MEIRFAQIKDYNQIEVIALQIHVLHIGLRPDVYAPMSVMITEEKYKDYLKENRIIVAEEKDTIYGYSLTLERIAKGPGLKTRRILFVDSMAVDINHRNNGVGSSLLDYWKMYVRDNGYDSFELQVNALNIDALNFYKKNGMIERSLNMEYRYDNLTMDNRYASIKEKLFIDCSNCSGLCCVDLYFAKSEGFPYDKPAGESCRNLMENFYCNIHDSLLEKKMKGCLAYDCFGAGQKVTSVIYKGTSWRASQKTADQISAVFLIITRLHQMLWYLIEASSIDVTKDLWEDMAWLIEENIHMADLAPEKILELDLEQYKKRVDQILKKSSELVALSFQKPEGHKKQEYTDKEKISDYIGINLQKKDLTGKDFSMCLLIAANIKGCKLKGANFLGTDMRDTNIEDADLSESFFLTQGQINAARGNAGTKLPVGLVRPLTWKR